MADSDNDAGFLTRWSRRKVEVRQGHALRDAPVARDAQAASAAVVHTPVATTAEPVIEPAPADQPPPTLDDVARLEPTSDFRRFIAPEVMPEVRNAALKQLFADPHFNVMDGLDIYIDDYGKPDPLPIGMLRRMAQAQALKLFADEPTTPAEPPAASTAPQPEPPADEDPALRLQPHDAAGPPLAEPGAVEGRGGQR